MKPTPTPTAIEIWNQASGAVEGLFHVTCQERAFRSAR